MARLCLLACILVGYVATGFLGAEIPSGLGTCLKNTPLANFKPSDLLNGTWKVSINAFQTFPSDECIDVDIETVDDNTTATVSIPGVKDSIVFAQQKNYSLLQTTLYTGLVPQTEIDAYGSIFATNRRNWALIYLCMEFIDGKFESPLLLLRNQTNNQRFIPEIKAAAAVEGFLNALSPNIEENVDISC